LLILAKSPVLYIFCFAKKGCFSKSFLSLFKQPIAKQSPEINNWPIVFTG